MTTRFWGPKSSRDFRVTGPRPEFFPPFWTSMTAYPPKKIHGLIAISKHMISIIYTGKNVRSELLPCPYPIFLSWTKNSRAICLVKFQQTSIRPTKRQVQSTNLCTISDENCSAYKAQIINKAYKSYGYQNIFLLFFSCKV